jgi:hypothetical protein
LERRWRETEVRKRLLPEHAGGRGKVEFWRRRRERESEMWSKKKTQTRREEPPAARRIYTRRTEEPPMINDPTTKIISLMWTILGAVFLPALIIRKYRNQSHGLRLITFIIFLRLTPAVLEREYGKVCVFRSSRLHQATRTRDDALQPFSDPIRRQPSQWGPPCRGDTQGLGRRWEIALLSTTVSRYVNVEFSTRL